MIVLILLSDNDGVVVEMETPGTRYAPIQGNYPGYEPANVGKLLSGLVSAYPTLQPAQRRLMTTKKKPKEDRI
jgi:hypothetical protein